jgi:hypothetical protein
MKQAFIALALGCTAWATSSFADPARVATVLCYLRSDRALAVPNTSNSNPSANAQQRAAGISVTRTATGTYLLSVGGSPWGLDGYGQISPYGSGFDILCHVGNWSAEITNLFPICQSTCP